MKRIVHISDVHFGRDIPKVVAGLIRDVREAEPDLVILSGDFTQRAHASQYLRAKKMIDALPTPRIVIPGNHDIPLYNLFARFASPKQNYKRFISRKTQMSFESDEVCVVALDSSRGYSISNGTLNDKQIEKAVKQLESWGDRLKIVVTHHPYSAPEKFRKAMLINRAEISLEAFSKAGADVFLAGHLHLSYTGTTKDRYPEIDRCMLVLSCGTSTSNRGRGEPNNYNVLECEPGRIRLLRKWWDDKLGVFVVASEQVFHKHGKDWSELKTEPDTLVEPTPTEEPPPDAEEVKL
jgi:3',5'-cyclic AMP phosphodiesterase CpdA